MTDTIIQFRYSDDVFMTSIYINSDTHQEIFIPLLLEIAESCEDTNRIRGWGYVVAEIVSKIVSKYESKVQFVLESQFAPTSSIYKYSVTIAKNLYANDKNKLVDYLKIKEYKRNRDGFDGLLKDFVAKIESENNQYKIEYLEENIKSMQEKIKQLKNKQKV